MATKYDGHLATTALGWRIESQKLAEGVYWGRYIGVSHPSSA